MNHQRYTTPLGTFCYYYYHLAIERYLLEACATKRLSDGTYVYAYFSLAYAIHGLGYPKGSG